MKTYKNPGFTILSIGALLLGSFLVILLAINQMKPNISSSDILSQCTRSLDSSTDYEIECKKSYNNKIREYRASYDKWSLQNRGQVLAWQHLSSILMFILFASVLVFGLVLTYKEFNKETNEAITLTIGDNGLSITSEIVGVVILVISLAFTYVYVDRVFPVSEVAPVQSNKK